MTLDRYLLYGVSRGVVDWRIPPEQSLLRSSGKRAFGHKVEFWKLFPNYNNLSLKMYQTTRREEWPTRRTTAREEDILRMGRSLLAANIISRSNDDDTER